MLLREIAHNSVNKSIARDVFLSGENALYRIQKVRSRYEHFSLCVLSLKVFYIYIIHIHIQNTYMYIVSQSWKDTWRANPIARCYDFLYERGSTILSRIVADNIYVVSCQRSCSQWSKRQTVDRIYTYTWLFSTFVFIHCWIGIKRLLRYLHVREIPLSHVVLYISAFIRLNWYFYIMKIYARA